MSGRSELRDDSRSCRNSYIDAKTADLLSRVRVGGKLIGSNAVKNNLAALSENSGGEKGGESS